MRYGAHMKTKIVFLRTKSVIIVPIGPEQKGHDYSASAGNV